MGPGTNAFRPGSFGAIRALQRSRPWSFVFFLLLAAQVALGVHQLEHRLRPDAAALGDDCALCHVASTLAAAPEAAAFAPPVFIAVGTVLPPAQSAPATARAVAGFRSRAPPLPVSA